MLDKETWLLPQLYKDDVTVSRSIRKTWKGIIELRMLSWSALSVLGADGYYLLLPVGNQRRTEIGSFSLAGEDIYTFP